MSYISLKNCLKSSLFGGLLLFLQPLGAQLNWSNLDAGLQSRQKQLGTDLVVMAWKMDDTLVYKKELGSFNSKTPAAIGSASKWLTVALVMQFVEEGKLSLDDKVSQWLPEFARYGKNYITLRTCLSNTTGIEDDVKFAKKLFQRQKQSSLEEEVNVFASREIRANPTQDFWYGNIGINIAGRVLEVISKKKFDVLIKQKLFTPLGMRRTSFTTIDNSAVNPSGGAQTNADDYIKFLAMLLNKGKFAGKQILTEESVKQMMQVAAQQDIFKFAPKSVKGFNYALGSWILEEKDGKATALSSYGFSGTWPLIDYCRGYAFLILPKEPVEEEKAENYMQLKAILDEQFKNNCP